jgi:hypothetical protein
MSLIASSFNGLIATTERCGGRLPNGSFSSTPAMIVLSPSGFLGRMAPRT